MTMSKLYYFNPQPLRVGSRVAHITSNTGSLPAFPSCRHDLVQRLRASSRSDCFTATACQELSYAHSLSTPPKSQQF